MCGDWENTVETSDPEGADQGISQTSEKGARLTSSP